MDMTEEGLWKSRGQALEAQMRALIKEWEERAQEYPQYRTPLSTCAFELRCVIGGDLLEDFRRSAAEAADAQGRQLDIMAAVSREQLAMEGWPEAHDVEKQLGEGFWCSVTKADGYVKYDCLHRPTSKGTQVRYVQGLWPKPFVEDIADELRSLLGVEP